MDLEVISREPRNRRFETPLLFIHGAWHGAWCWDHGFLEYFAEKGFSVHALSLRGHGGSDGGKHLRACRISDYVDDVKSVAEKLDGRPIIVGHSMGGAVVQKYLETEPAVGGVLMASLPVTGVLATLIRTHIRHPVSALKMHLTLNLFPLVEDVDTAQKMFFSSDIPKSELLTFHSQLQNESYRAFLDMLILNLPKPKKVKAPVLVLGAENDTVFLPSQVRATAAAYSTEAVMFPNMAHDMMLEEGWVSVADKIMEWAIGLSADARITDVADV